MSTYVISDIHGEIDRFHSILNLINFSDNDTLYFIGDAIDRGPEGVAILQEIMKTPNIKMLLGNHEHMFMRYYAEDVTDIEIRRWNKNNNTPTKNAYLKLTETEQKELMSFINSLPTHFDIEVNGRKFYLVHGFPGDNLHDEIWGRPMNGEKNPFADKTLIIGHTPVLYFMTVEENLARQIMDMTISGESVRILYTKEFIDIDCGSGYLDVEPRRLACLRLEDMKEFYA